MSNYKIRVNGEAKSKEAQELFFELGYEKGVCSTGGYPALIIATPESRFQKTPYSSRATSLNHEAHSQYKEITLPDLRDMVVLKRNDVGDATHTDGHYSFYVGKDKNYFFSSCYKAWRGTWKNVDILKPIEKKEMKEYLDKQQDGTYELIKADGGCIDRDWIEIPEGSETFNHYDRKDNLFFLKGSGEDTMFSNDLNDWEWKEWGDIDFDGVVCLWSRHTHPEELPFIDDDFKLNIPEELKGRADLLSGRIIIDDEPLKVIDSEYSKDGNSVTHTVLLNDQYAEIETVRQTLNQRQEQYGSFEDVAMITEQMVDVMRKGYYENLAYNQKMALYMICSKMARIVNGNPNHKDSWHDIAGYATLIDNELVSEKDMPF